jgi:hypothetical protein
MKFNIKVTNKETKRVDYHRGLTREDISFISSNPNLHIEVLSEDYDLPSEEN